jgi:2-keto-4-pentenoate hydratase
LNSLVWLANILCEQGNQLKAGDLVSTGVCTDIYFTESVDHIVADFGSLGIAEEKIKGSKIKGSELEL